MTCWKKILTIALVLGMLLSVTACGEKSTLDPTQTNSNAPQASADLNDKELVAEYTKLLEGYAMELTGCSPDTVIATVNGESITVEQFLYQFTEMCAYYQSLYLSSGMEFNLDELMSSGVTIGQTMANQAIDNLIYQIVIEQESAKRGITVTEEQQKLWDDALASYKETYGEVGYAKLLAAYGVTDETFNRNSMTGYLEESLLAAVVPEPSEKDLDSYIAVSGTLSAKHILICTVEKKDDGKLYYTGSGRAATTASGAPMEGDPEEFNAEALKKAEDLLKQINEAADPITEFDVLMRTHSQDTGLAAKPDGYVFTSGQMVDEFENTTLELEYNEISGVVKSVYGYHIILRLKPDMRDAYVKDYTILQQQAWINGCDFAFTGAMEDLEARDIFEKYTVYQAKVMAVENGT